MTSLCSICSAMLGFWYMYASVCGVEEFHVLLRGNGTSDLEVDSRPALGAVTSLLMLVFPTSRSLFLRPVVTAATHSMSCLSTCMRIFLGYFPETFPYSALSGTTVDTCCTHSANCARFLGLSARSHLPSPMRKWPPSSLTTVVWLVLPVTMRLALSFRQWYVQG